LDWQIFSPPVPVIVINLVSVATQLKKPVHPASTQYAARAGTIVVGSDSKPAVFGSVLRIEALAMSVVVATNVLIEMAAVLAAIAVVAASPA
jgi:hypothetical protein